MALNASKFPPKSTTDLLTDGVYQPIPLSAKAGDPAVNIFNGDSEWNNTLGVTVPTQVPEPVTIDVDGQNLVDIIADLTARIVALETP
jgi:hypothetical protein